MLIPRDDLPWCDGGHAAGVASFGAINSGRCLASVLSSRDLEYGWKDIPVTGPLCRRIGVADRWVESY